MPAAPLGRETMSPALESASNYHAWTFSWISPYLDAAHILDIGSGTANHITYLADRDLVSVDVDPRVVEELRARYKDSRPRWRFEVADVTDGQSIDRLGRGQFDVVMSCNVFEHIEDDWAAFRGAYELLKPGGRIVLLLPAHALLFGSVDRLAGHFRRYDRRALKQRFAATGFVEEEIRYVNLAGAFGWFINNRVVRHDDIGAPSINTQIRIFDRWMIPLLRKVEGRRSLPFGQSVLAVGQKPGV